MLTKSLTHKPKTTMAKKEKKQPIMSGWDVLTVIESLLIFGLVIVTLFSLWAVLFKGAIHQLVIAIPCAVLAVTLTWHQVKEREER